VSDVTGSVDEVKALVSALDGVLDRVFLSLRDGKEQADLSLRVFTPDFKQGMDSIERVGDVQIKELRETTNPMDGEATRAEDPDARINVSFVEETGSSNTKLIVSIVAPIGGVAIAGVFGFLFYLTYRVGRQWTLL